MKTPFAPTDCLFQDRPLPDSPLEPPRISSPALPGCEYNDPLETLLRLLLVLCLLISLAICLRQWTGGPNPSTGAGYVATSAPAVEPGCLPRVSQPLSARQRVVHADI